ncbi:proline-rich transmembrane protein 4 isoform X2 [Pristis pectinata]|uniref:proline-rich transmembrane protein 4 isoform X2 n=1 Tax=Pristis pectinata TaxID=685728 RepID=UPI00223D47E9|nr:proline-rich transmembrane protein 4 isoform X2 [Pristis pectinata]
MLHNSIIFVYVISSFVMESKITALGVTEHEVPRATSPSFESDVTGLIHLTTTSHQGFGLKLPLASSGLPPETESNVNPLLHSQMSTPPEQRQASISSPLMDWVPMELPVERDTATEPLLVPHIRLKSDDNSENVESFNQDDIGSPKNTEQLQAATFSNENQRDVPVVMKSLRGAIPTGHPEIMNKPSNSTDISIQNLSTVGLHPMGSLATSLFSLMYPATSGTTHESLQERSMMPIYTFPNSQKRPATVRPIITTQSTEVLTKIKPRIQMASDLWNNDHSVLFTVSELPPGILSPSSKNVTHQTVTSANDKSNNGLSTLKATPLGITQFNKDVVSINTAAPSNTLGRSEPISKSHLTSSSDKWKLDYLFITLLSSTPAYQTQQMKVDEQPGIATDSIVGDENSSGIGSPAAPTVSSYSPKRNCSSCKDWSSVYPDVEGTQDTSFDPHFLVVPPLFVILHTDWNTALAEWGLAWDLHVYGLGSAFGFAGVMSALGILCLPFRSPSGFGYFMVLNGLLFLTSSTRTFTFLYDAYCYQDKLPATVALLLYDLVFPCLTSAFGVIILVLSLRPGMQVVASRFKRSCLLIALVFLHFTLSVSIILVITLLKQAPFLLFVSHGSFVVLVTILSILFFAVYCHIHVVDMHVYNVKSSAHSMEAFNTHPFGDIEHWGRMAKLAMWTAVFGLCCAAFQLYAILYGLGLAGDHVFQPWPWWIFQFGTSLCEVGMSLTMSIIGIYPLFCNNKLTDHNCCTKMFCLSPNHASMKAPILANTYQWSTSHQAKPLSCDAIVRSESECLPLYTMSDNQLSSGEDINLIYHSSEIKNLDFHLKHGRSSRTSSFISVRVDSDSTVDLRPPSPINLRRSIDEALFSEALIPEGLFHWSRLHSSSNMSLCENRSLPSSSEVFKEKAADRGLYRTSSCAGIERPEVGRGIASTFRKLNVIRALSVDRWEDSSASSVCRMSQGGSSLALCSNPERRGFPSISSEHKYFRNSSQISLPQIPSQFQAPPAPEDMDNNDLPDSATQAEFMKICRQIDQLSISSDTIEL